MRPSDTLNLKRTAVHEATPRFRATSPHIFGSILYSTDQEGNDLDLLVDALPGAALVDLSSLEVEREEILGVPVDLLKSGDVLPKLRVRVLAEAHPVWATQKFS